MAGAAKRAPPTKFEKRTSVKEKRLSRLALLLAGAINGAPPTKFEVQEWHLFYAIEDDTDQMHKIIAQSLLSDLAKHAVRRSIQELVCTSSEDTNLQGSSRQTARKVPVL
ncbi:unnamed protein product [Polarella glacialis]|uniref:Uncharacterized protein n=1 Tax=Polarella glacialis TaxID=89957 RepID=A0A813H2B7_POLGL|nr:unnamed protein product [Polarella glacialis]